jgi:hypothetical protein
MWEVRGNIHFCYDYNYNNYNKYYNHYCL